MGFFFSEIEDMNKIIPESIGTKYGGTKSMIAPEKIRANGVKILEAIEAKANMNCIIYSSY